MKARKTLIPVLSVIFLLGCAAAPYRGQDEPLGRFAVEGSILARTEASLILTIQVPPFRKTPDSAMAEIAQQVVRKSYLLEGMKIAMEGREGTVTEVRGDQVKMAFAQAPPYTPGQKVSVQVPKKTIAVVDFEVLGANRQEKGRVVLEGLTSALIDTGQFIVVERTKLQPILNEIRFSQSGMTRPATESLEGRLLSADLILTGTLTDLREEWDINLRILNVRTGQALSAVSMRSRLFRPTGMRDASAWMEDFEGLAIDPSWIFKAEAKTKGKKRKGGRQSMHIDSNQGAGSSHKSMRIDFDFPEAADRNQYAVATNRKKRDITLYKGAEFYTRGTGALVGQFYLLTSHPDDPNKIDQWTGLFNVDETWKKVRIPFDSMVSSLGWIKGGAKRMGATLGDQVMRLHRVEGVQFGVGSDKNEEAAGSLWIDDIRFYND